MMSFIRLFALLACILTSYIFPWFISFPIITAAIFIFPWFLEGLIATLILDTFYSSPVPYFPLIFTLICFIFVVGVEYARTVVRI